ncbi:MAG: glycosyltransferase family 4 protein, partial [Candidatus Ratteibacteria bacterium]
VIYNGIDIEKYETLKDENFKNLSGLMDKKIVLTGGRLSGEKGLKYFIYAAKKVIQQLPETVFIIAGEGPEKNSLKHMSDSLRLSENIIFTGYRKDLPVLIKNCDVAVLSSLWEGMPNFILEAMSMKKPVVATDIGGTKEIVVDGENGFLVPVKDFECLAEKIIFILKNPSISEKMGEKGYKIVKEKFSLEKMIKNYENLYTGLLHYQS